LKADVEKAVATLAKFTTEVGQRGEDISTWKGDIKAATAVRNQKKTNYDTSHADYPESVDALERAISITKTSTADPQAGIP